MTKVGRRTSEKRGYTGWGVALLVLVLLGGSAALLTLLNSSPPAGKIGEIAPDYRFTDTFGRSSSLTEQRGRPVIITAMAAWCVSCAVESRNLLQVHERVNGKVFILSLDVDPQDTLESLRTFQSRYGGNWSFALDQDGAVRKFHIRLLDTTLILDREGRIVFRDERPTTVEEFMSVLADLGI